MSYKLPNIILTMLLEPFITAYDKETDIHEKEINNLPEDIQHIIKERIKNNYEDIITDTISHNYNVISYNYDDIKN